MAMMNTSLGILSKLGGDRDEFTQKERKVKTYIQENLHLCSNFSIQELSKATGVSKATISRFCRRLGYANYRDFSLALAQEATANYSRINEDIKRGDSIEDIAVAVLHTEHKALDETLEMLRNIDLEALGDLILQAKRVMIFAVGGSACVAMDLYHKLCRLGISCAMQLDITFQKVLATQLTPSDVAWVVSLSGYDAEMIQIARVARTKEAKVVGMLNDYNSPLSRLCDYTLYGAFLNNFLYTGTTESRLSLMYITDVLYTLLSVRGAPDTIRKLQETRLILTERALQRDR